MKLPRHAPDAFDAATIAYYLETPDEWFKKGSDLFECAEILRRRRPKNSYTQYVGLPAWTMTQRFGYTCLQPTAAMLFGMAIECWCKGLILKSKPSTKPADLYRFGHKLQDLCGEAGVILSQVDTESLELLESLILGMGRYPLPKKAESIIPTHREATRAERWMSLRVAINRRYEALL